MDFIKIGNRIQKLRTEREYTQNELANLCEISEKYVSNIETGRDHCSLETLLAIANNLNSSMDYLIGDELTYNKFISNKNPIIKDINHQLNILTEKQQNFIYSMVTQLINSNLL